MLEIYKNSQDDACIIIYIVTFIDILLIFLLFIHF